MNGFFKVACQDLARMVSVLSLNSADVSKPRSQNSFWINCYEKSVYFFRFFYMVFYKGFTPTVFDLMPYSLWRVLTIAIYGYRFAFLPLLFKITGYAKYVDWSKPKIGSAQPKPDSWEAQIYPELLLSEKGRLATVVFGDNKFEQLLHTLFLKTTHLSPHSQSPGNPFVAGFPGNFMNHLTGVYKILVAWKQPQYVCRAGMFHSVYGTFDYRAGVYDLRQGRDELIRLIGPGAEELAFAICTSDRLGLLSDLCDAMYGPGIISRYGTINQSVKLNSQDGNALPLLVGQLSAEGFLLRNHVTQVNHVIPPDCFAQFIVVFCADFMDQGALPFASADMDVCLFQFMRFRFFNDVLRFVSPYLRAVPLPFKKHMWDRAFLEPTRLEVLDLKRMWTLYFSSTPSTASSDAVHADKQSLLHMVEGYPYLAEPRLLLAGLLGRGEVWKGHSRQRLAASARGLIEDWGMMSYKKAAMAIALDRITELIG